MQAVLLEEDEIQLSDLRAEVSAEGHKGGNIIKEYNDGMRLRLHRPLLDKAQRLPGIAVGTCSMLLRMQRLSRPSDLPVFSSECCQQHSGTPAYRHIHVQGSCT